MAEDKKKKQDDFEVEWEGDYVAKLDRLYELAEERKQWLASFRLGGKGDDESSSSGLSAGMTPGSNNEEIVWNFFAAKGFTAAGVAGVMGNLRQESSFSPTVIQGGGKGPGTGLVQWSNPGRWNKLETWASGEGKDKWALETQLEFLWNEMTGGPGADPWWATQVEAQGGIEFYKTTGDHEAAVRAFEEAIEKAGKPNYPNRYKYAKEFLDKYGNGKGNAVAGTVGLGTNVAGGALPGGLKAASISSGKVVVPEANKGYHSTISKGRRAAGFNGYITLDSGKYYSNLSGCSMLVAPEFKPFVDLLYENFRAKGLLVNDKMPVNSVFRAKDPDSGGPDNGAHGWGAAIDVGCFGVKDALAKADIAWALGFRRVAPGGSLNSGRGFVHIDIGPPGGWSYDPYPKYSGPGSWSSYR